MTRPPLMMNPFCLACWKHSMIHHYTHCTTSGPKNWNGAKSRQGRTFSFFLLLFWSHLMLVRYRLIALRCWSSTNLGLENDEPLIFVRLQKEHIVENPLKKSHSAILREFCIFSLNGDHIWWLSNNMREVQYYLCLDVFAIKMYLA